MAQACPVGQVRPSPAEGSQTFIYSHAQSIFLVTMSPCTLLSPDGLARRRACSPSKFFTVRAAATRGGSWPCIRVLRPSTLCSSDRGSPSRPPPLARLGRLRQLDGSPASQGRIVLASAIIAGVVISGVQRISSFDCLLANSIS